MNFNESNPGEPGRVLRLRVQHLGGEVATPVEIKIANGGRPWNHDLPVLLGRPRRRQETRKTVAPAPRQSPLVNA